MENFWNSNLFQTLVSIMEVIVLIVTVGITLWKYHKNKRNKIRDAARILILQINDIEQNVEYILSEGFLNGLIQEAPMHYSALIFDDNQWTRYSHLIVGEVSQSTFSQIDAFYKVASRIREQQIFIKQKIQQSIDFKTLHYYNAIYGSLNELGNSNNTQNIVNLYNNSFVPSYIHLELARGLEKTLKQYHKLTDGVAFAELKKLQ